jgi:hypothetical protein
VHVLVVGDELGAARPAEVAGTGDDVAEGGGEALAEPQPAGVHVTVLALAQRRAVARVGLQQADSVGDDAGGGRQTGPGGIERERTDALR